MEAANRKLIRPSLTELKEKADAKRGQSGLNPPLRQQAKPAAAPAGPPANQNQQASPSGGAPPQKKSSPSEQTNAENFYYAKQISNKTPMVVVLRGGEQLEGVIQWYDKTCIRLTRTDRPAVLIYKESIRYMFKHD